MTAPAQGRNRKWRLNPVNMSYCRYQNTLGDLVDCADQIESLLVSDPTTTPITNNDERCARVELIEQCFEIVALFVDAGVEEDHHDLRRAIEQAILNAEQCIPAQEDEGS